MDFLQEEFNRWRFDLIVERERAIRNYTPEQVIKRKPFYYTAQKQLFQAQLSKAFSMTDEAAKCFSQQNINAEFKVQM